MRKLLVFLMAAVLLALPAAAKSLTAIVPSRPVMVLYTQNLAVKKAFFVDFQAELKRQKLTLEDLIELFAGDEKPGDQELDELKRYLKLFSLDAVGEEGILAVYPDGSLLALARPSARVRETFFRDLREVLGRTRPMNGWNVKYLDQEGDLALIAGYRDGLALLLVSPNPEDSIALGFLKGDAATGVRLPLAGDVVFYLDARPLEPLIQGAAQSLPPRVVNALLTPKEYAAALTVVKQGLESQSRFVLDPEADPALAKLLLPENCRPWPLETFPRAQTVASYCFSLPEFGDYLSELSAAAGFELPLDLSAFGDRLALVSLVVPTENPAELMQKPLGDMLLYLEARDDLTAETTLMSWLQMFAASSTPEGQGGFEVSRYDVGPYQGKKITLGIGQPVFLFNLGDRLVLATSEVAAQTLAGPRLKDDPDFARWAGRIPEDAVLESYSNARGAFKILGEQLAATTPLFVEDPEELPAMMEFNRRLAKFFEFLDQRLGVSIAYTRVRGNVRVSEGMTEVRW